MIYPNEKRYRVYARHVPCASETCMLPFFLLLISNVVRCRGPVVSGLFHVPPKCCGNERFARLLYAKSSEAFDIYLQETIDAARRATKENGASSSGVDDASAGGGALLRKIVGASAAVGQEKGAGGKSSSSRMVLSDDEVLHQFIGCVRVPGCVCRARICRWTIAMIGREGSEATIVRLLLPAAFMWAVHCFLGGRRACSDKMI